MTPQQVRSQQSILHLHRTLVRAAFSLVLAFSWIFVFEFTFEFSGSVTGAFLMTFVVYALSQITLLIATPLSAAHLRRGIKRGMFFGVLLAALAFAVLGATLAGYFSSPLSWGLVLFGMLLGAYRALYWIPYRLQSASSSNETNIFFEILLALLPAFAGITLVSFPFSSLRLLLGAVALLLVSLVPIFFLRDHGETFQWNYVETFGKLFDRRYRTLALRSTLSGIESTTLFLIWPLSIFLIVGRSYLIFGLVITISLLILLVGRGLYRQLRLASLPQSLPLDVAFSVSGWVLRLAAGTPLMIVFADSYSYVSAPAGAPEFISREHASDAGSYVDEYTALQEIGMAFGRIVMCLFAGALLFTTPLPIALALALIVTAFAAGAATALSHKRQIEAY
jgi:hypothetical protein